MGVIFYEVGPKTVTKIFSLLNCPQKVSHFNKEKIFVTPFYKNGWALEGPRGEVTMESNLLYL